MGSDKTILKYSFSKNEKLCSEKRIEELFKSGRSFIAYPLRVVFYIDNSCDDKSAHPSILISVAKKKFKRAVKRNLIKRRIREAYRLNKRLLDTKENNIAIAFLYLNDEIVMYPAIEKAMQKALLLIGEKLLKK